jgi:hypothetical protein
VLLVGSPDLGSDWKILLLTQCKPHFLLISQLDEQYNVIKRAGLSSDINKIVFVNLQE